MTPLAEWWGLEAERFNEGLYSSLELCSELPRAGAMSHSHQGTENPRDGQVS